MKITSDIYIVGGSSYSDMSDAAVYLVTSGKESALIDAGTGKGTDAILANIKKTGTDPGTIKYLFLTHCHYDHSGGVNELREKTGCTVIAHELTAEYLEAGDSRVTAASWYGTFMEPTKVDESIAGKHREFPLGDLILNFHHTPGHSPGSSIIYVESDGKKVLFGQDVHGPLNEVLLSVRQDYIESLGYMLSLNADILCEGHFGIYQGREKVKEFIESFL